MNLDQLKTYLTSEWRSFVAEAVRLPRPAQAKTDEAKLIESASEGAAVRGFLESPQVLDFMARTEAKLTHEMLGLPLDDDAGRRNLAVAIQTQRQLWKYLTTMAGDGVAAERELERLRSGRRDFF